MCFQRYAIVTLSAGVPDHFGNCRNQVIARFDHGERNRDSATGGLCAIHTHNLPFEVFASELNRVCQREPRLGEGPQ
jgi:hypothetical protein